MNSWAQGGVFGELEWMIPSQGIPGFLQCAQADPELQVAEIWFFFFWAGRSCRKSISPETLLSQEPSREGGEPGGEKRQLCLKIRFLTHSDNSTKPAGSLLSGIRLALKVNQLAQLQVRTERKTSRFLWVGLFVLNSPGHRKIPSSLPHLKPPKAGNSWLASATLTQSH